jgi:hypothetical protein
LGDYTRQRHRSPIHLTQILSPAFIPYFLSQTPSAGERLGEIMVFSLDATCAFSRCDGDSYFFYFVTSRLCSRLSDITIYILYDAPTANNDNVVAK